jgi:hypothetical protein
MKMFEIGLRNCFGASAAQHHNVNFKNYKGLRNNTASDIDSGKK